MKRTSEQREIQLHFLIIKILNKCITFFCLLVLAPWKPHYAIFFWKWESIYDSNNKTWFLNPQWAQIHSEAALDNDYWLLGSSFSGALDLQGKKWSNLRCPRVGWGYETKGTVLLDYFTDHNVLHPTPWAPGRQMQWLRTTTSEQRTVQSVSECFQKS